MLESAMPVRRTVAGKVEGEYRIAAKGKPAGLQHPAAVVESAAMQEYDDGQAGIEGFAAGGNKRALCIEIKVHIGLAPESDSSGFLRGFQATGEVDLDVTQGFQPH
ncbi:MAG: hypothetical protein R3E89_15270 [Thiolinea sp.]